MINDKKLKISTAGSRKATTWITQELYWSEFVEKIRSPVKSAETLQQYLGYSKGVQDDLKDVGGFVGGQLANNRRKNENVIGRDLITLDIDNIPSEGTTGILQCLGSQTFAYAVYSTRKHEPVKPRLRIIIPLDQTCSADEYEPIARKLASILGIAFCDPTTFEASRLMYWPSCCSDSQYVFNFADKPFVNKDGVLGMYADWKDVSQWPVVPSETKLREGKAKKQEDPTAKKGVVGAFCKVYNVETAIAAFLPDKYTQTDLPDRYTFSEGSTTGGAIIYEGGNFLFSHHATDPCSGKLVNAFDLIRLHKFGDQDDEAAPGTPTNRLPSFTAMRQFAAADQAVVELLNRERYEQAQQDFSEVNIGVTADDADIDEFSKRLQVDSYGNRAKTIDNVLVVLGFDPRVKDRFFFDELDNCVVITDYMPWDDKETCIKPPRRWDDDSGLRWYLEKYYGIKGGNFIDHGFEMACLKNRKNKIKDYLTSLEWDGVKRLDTLLIDYFGAEDNIYTRAVMRKSLAAAVARTMYPGTKFDCMLVLGGPQGIGKSTFFQKLGKGDWYSDNLQTFEGKEACESIQGFLLVEIGELSALNRSEINAVKLFLSRTEDIYREPYGRRTKKYPRRCVLFGTTNDSEYLKDPTGNRRFWPVDLGITSSTKNVFKDLDGEVDQIWAEAYVAWQLGESLYLSGDVEAMSKMAQEDHKESNPKEGMIIEFLSRKVPVNWNKLSLNERRMFLANDQMQSGCELVERDRVCAAELYCECFGGDPKYMKRQDSIEINSILRGINGLVKYKTPRRFGDAYGKQKGFHIEKMPTLEE